MASLYTHADASPDGNPNAIPDANADACAGLSCAEAEGEAVRELGQPELAGVDLRNELRPADIL